MFYRIHLCMYPDLLTTVAAICNSCFWLVDFFKSSSLKLLGQMNRNLVGSTYGRLCIKFPISIMKGQRHRLRPPTKFRFIWPSSFREEDLKKSTNQKQELPMAATVVNRSG
jgi:hypothetical protein